MSEIEEKVLKLFESGMNVINIKQELNIPIWKISKIIENPQQNKISDVQSEILKMFKAGNEIFSIKEKLNVPIWKIYKAIQSHDDSNMGESLIRNADGLEFNSGGLSKNIIRELLGEEKYQEELVNKFLDIFNEDEKNEIIKKGSDVILSCLDCKYSTTLDKTKAALTIYRPSTLKYLGLLNKRKICDICDSYRLLIQRKSDNKIIYNPNNEKNCNFCSEPIILPRLEIQPETNTCNLCATGENIPNPFPKSPLDNCPECHSNIIQVLNNDGEIKLYCERFHGTRNKNINSCNWVGDYEDYAITNIHDKEYFDIIKKFRLEISKKEDVPLFYILTNEAIEEIVKHTPITPKEMIEKCPSVSRNFIDKYSGKFYFILRKLSNKGRELSSEISA